MGRVVRLSFLVVAAAPMGMAVCAEPEAGAPSPLALKLERGICIDRQVRTMPPEPGMRVYRDDIRLIKSMGFGFVKFLVNPAVLQAGSGLDASRVGYFDHLVNLAADEGLPTVVCIHPEDDFKRSVLGNADQFERFFGFMQALSRHMAGRWGPRQVALQLMTEPYGGSPNPADWNHWNRLQQRLWKAVRNEMAGHTLILSGDLIGSIEGLYNLQPVDDGNVLYCFTFYEPHLFTFQGGQWQSGVFPHLRGLPYPSKSTVLADHSRYLGPVPEGLRAAAKSQIEQYARESWDRSRLAARIDKAIAWQRRWGGRVKLWCAEFGCYQKAADPADRCRYLGDLRTVFEERGIGWAYWSYNETFTIMTPDSMPFAPPRRQTPDARVLKVLLSDL